MPNSDYVCGQRRPWANHNQTFNRARRLPHSQQFSNCCVHHTAPHHTAAYRECGGRQNLFGGVPRAMTTSLSLENRLNFCPKRKRYSNIFGQIDCCRCGSCKLPGIYWAFTWIRCTIYNIYIYMFYSNKLVMHINVCVCVSSFSYALNLMESSLGEQSFYMFYSCKFVSYE